MRPSWRRMAEPQPRTTYLFGLKRFPAMIARPMAPFFVAGLIMIYAIDSFGDVLAQTDEYKNDPRNPRLRNGGKPAEN